MASITVSWRPAGPLEPLRWPRRSVMDDRQEETCLPGHSASEADSQGDGKELRCSARGPGGPSVPSECS